MKLELNVYSKEKDKNGKRMIAKTYTSNGYDVLYGTVEDILNLFDGANINNDDEIIKLVRSAKEQVSFLLKDIFFGLTDDELKMVSVKDMAKVIVNVLKYAILEMATETKNAMRG